MRRPCLSIRRRRRSSCIRLTVLKIDDLDFGSVIVTGAGTILLNPVTGAVTATGGVIPVAGSPHAARFVGAASGNSVVNIKLPKQPVTLTRVSGTETMTAYELHPRQPRQADHGTGRQLRVQGRRNGQRRRRPGRTGSTPGRSPSPSNILDARGKISANRSSLTRGHPGLRSFPLTQFCAKGTCSWAFQNLHWRQHSPP